MGAWAIRRRATRCNERSRRLKTAGIVTTGKVTDARERASQFSNGTFMQATVQFVDDDGVPRWAKGVMVGQVREGTGLEARYLRGEVDRSGGCEIAPNKKFVKGYELLLQGNETSGPQLVLRVGRLCVDVSGRGRR